METTMSRTRQSSLILLFTLFVTGAMLRPVSAQPAGARAIEGVWAMTITLRDCATTTPLGPPFRSLLTFHAGGTMSESPATTQFSAGQRSPGHGLWSFSNGSTFDARFVAMILFDTPPAPPAPGFQAGWQIVTSTFNLADANRLTLSATVQFFDLNRNVYRLACPTGTAERFQ
jgi:hypothetical protein